MAEHSTLPRVDRISVSSPTAHARWPALRTAAAAGFVVAGLQYLVIETAAASAWASPAYSYAANFVSDLGAPARGTFEGRAIDSPLHAVMNTGFIVQGVLFLATGVLLGRLMTRRARTAFVTVAALHAVGMVLVGAFHTSTQAAADGTLALHYAGATLAIIGGNVAAILAGRQWSRLGAPKWLAGVSTLLGVTGLLAVVVLVTTFGVLPPGVPERVAIYTFIAWELLTGVVLLMTRRPLVASATS